jgi:dihydrofolate reductase
MRKLIVTNIVSADGYYDGPGKDVMVMPFDVTFDDYNAGRLRAATTLLLGRTSFEGFRSYWPPVADRPDATEAEREISRRNNAIDKVVVSDTLTLDPSEPWGDSRVVPRADASAVVSALKSEEGGDILTFGSRIMWTSLLRAGLVDELHLLVGSAFLGGGTPIWDGGPRTPLRLLDVERLGGDSQLVLLRYDARPTA